MNTIYHFNIADWQIQLNFAHENEITGMHLLPSFAPFTTETSEGNLLLTMIIDQAWVPEDTVKHIKVCDTGNGDILVEKTADEGYSFVIRNLRGEDCAIMQSSQDFTMCRCKVFGEREEQHCFGLNNAMMMAYAFAGAVHNTLLVHASVVRHEGMGYAFIAKSGTGKSTQTQNWLKTIPNCDLMNDDNPVVRTVNGEVWIYGSPWSGKTPCYRQEKAPLGALTKIIRDADNFVMRMQPILAFNALLSSCSVMNWDKTTYRGICDTVKKVVEICGVYALHCTKDPESAVICQRQIKVNRGGCWDNQ